MVVSFLAILAGAFILADAILVWSINWVLDNGLFWVVAPPVGVAFLMAHLFR